MRKQTKLIVAMSATALLAIGASAVAMADGWDNSSGEWRYALRDGSYVSDAWRKSGDFWFYLGGDGYMVKEELVEYKDNYYYCNSEGAMVTNTWVPLEGDTNDDGAEYRWYYFGSDGKAYKNKSNGQLKTKDIKTINGKKYSFDEDGRMLYGWVNSDSMDISTNDDSDWSNTADGVDQYYFGGWNEGWVQPGWVQLTVDISGTDDPDSDQTDTYWFYFDSNGKKKKSKKFTEGGKTYYFDQYGRMVDSWVEIHKDGSKTDYYTMPEDSTLKATTATASQVVYVDGDGSARKNTWIWAVPADSYNSKDYEDDEYSWWWGKNDGKLFKNGTKKINGKTYIFDNIGRMQHSIVASVGAQYQDATKNISGSPLDYANVDSYIQDDDFVDYDGENFQKISFIQPTTQTTTQTHIQYYSNDEEHDGSRKTGYQNVEFNDGTYQMYFNTGNGNAMEGYVSKIKKYCRHGIVLKADVDTSNYGAIPITVDSADATVHKLFDEYNSTDYNYLEDDDAPAPIVYYYGDLELDELDLLAEGKPYRMVLVNSSGTVQTKKINMKDNNDNYYFTDDHGVIQYSGAKLKKMSSKDLQEYGEEAVVFTWKQVKYMYD